MTSDQYRETIQSLTARIQAGETAECLVPRTSALRELNPSIVHDLERMTGTKGRVPVVEAYKDSLRYGRPVQGYASREEADRLVRWCWFNNVKVGSITYPSWDENETVIEGPGGSWKVMLNHGQPEQD